MRTSDNIESIIEAFVAAQAEFKKVVKSKENAAYKAAGKVSKYAALSDIIEGVKEALAKHSLCIVQSPSFVENRVIVVTRLYHKSAEWIETSLSLIPSGFDPQKIGSAITYARRYSLAALMGVEAEDDDDGNAASDKVDDKKTVTTGKGFDFHAGSKTGAPKPDSPLVEQKPMTPEQAFNRMVGAFATFDISKEVMLAYVKRDNILEITGSDVSKLKQACNDMNAGQLLKEDFVDMAKGEDL